MSSEENCSCKFSRVLSKYDLHHLEEDIEQQWQSPEGPGLRSLAEEFNQHVLRAAFEEEGETLLEGEDENLYRLLMDGDVSAGTRREAENQVKQIGVDPVDLRDDFISYQTVNRHFKNCRNLTSEKGNSNSQEQTLKDRIFALQARTERVTESTLEQRGKLQFQEPNVFVDITVSCEECGTVASIEDAIDGVSCSCLE